MIFNHQSIFNRQSMPEFLHNNFQKNIFPFYFFFGGGGARSPMPPSPKAYDEKRA